MTPASPPAASPEPAAVQGQPRFGMWVVALALAVVVAVLAVQAAAGSVQRKQYAQDRATTIYFLWNGSTISASMQRLQELNAKDRVLMADTRGALGAGDTSWFSVPLRCSSPTRTREVDQ